MTIRLAIYAVLLPMIFGGVSCINQPAERAPVSLTYWRTEDSASTLSGILQEYQTLHPHITVNISVFPTDGYEQRLLEALAEGRGPDLMSIPNTWMTSWKTKVLPIPEIITMPVETVQNNRITITNRQTRGMTIRELTDSYVETVVSDVVMLATPTNQNEVPQSKIYGLPFSVDSLALFANTDILRQGSYETPARTWREVQEHATRLTIVNDDGVIVQSGAALGTANNIRHAPDILTVIMMQNGAEMARASDGRAIFNLYTPETSRNPMPPGAEALSFYQSFGRQGSTVYSWDTYMNEARDAFASGTVAYYFGYPSDMHILNAQAPNLNFVVAPLPQVNPGAPKHIAAYPVETVSMATRHPNEAWDFLQFAAHAEQVIDFLNEAERPTALRGLIATQRTDPSIAVFVNQTLTARSWYRGNNWSRVDEAFRTMIRTYPPAARPSHVPIVQAAANTVNTTIAP